MFKHFFQLIQNAIGLDNLSYINLFYMVIRGVIAYFFGMTITRFNKKLFGIRTPFNFVLFIMLGSVFANAILNADAFLPTLVTVLFLVLLNGSLTAIAFYSRSVEFFIKGTPSILVQNGEIQWVVMKKEFITERELLGALHNQLHTNDLSKIEVAILASDGTIDIIQKK